MLLIEGLQVEYEGRVILRNIDFEINAGETKVLFGNERAGKTSFLMTIMGFPQYKVTGGKIMFKGMDITHLPINERARMGIGISYQTPPAIDGLKTRHMVQICGGDESEVVPLSRKVNLQDFLERDVNAGFSPGEVKRSELLQVMAQNPELMLFDEPESGVDLENIALIGETIASLLQKECTPVAAIPRPQAGNGSAKMGLITTQTGYILDFLDADKEHVISGGALGCSGNPRVIRRCIGERGYEECIRCTIQTN